MAALDPNAAIAATVDNPPRAPGPLVVRESASAWAPTHVLDVELEAVEPISRWRFLVFWLLIRLAARVFRFGFEIRRSRDAE